MLVNRTKPPSQAAAPPQEAPADEVGEPDLAQGCRQEGQAGHPVGDAENFIGQQVEPVDQVGLVQVVDAVESGGEPGARGQHLLGDQGIHGLGPDQGNLPEKRQIDRQAGQQQGIAVGPGSRAGAVQVHGQANSVLADRGKLTADSFYQVRFQRNMVQRSEKPLIFRTAVGSKPECIMHWAQRGSLPTP